VPGEWELILEGLPCGEGADPGEPDRAALELFVRTARRVSAAFRLEPAQEPTVVRLCRRLEGLPLAIELAAAWVRHLGVERAPRRWSGTWTSSPARARAPSATAACSLASSTSGAAFPPGAEGLRRLSVYLGGASQATMLEVAQASLPLLPAGGVLPHQRVPPLRRPHQGQRAAAVGHAGDGGAAAQAGH